MTGQVPVKAPAHTALSRRPSCLQSTSGRPTWLLSPSDVIAVTIQSPWIGIKFYEDVPLFLDVHEFP